MRSNTNGEYGTVHPAREAREQVWWTCERVAVPRAWASGSATAPMVVDERADAFNNKG